MAALAGVAAVASAPGYRAFADALAGANVRVAALEAKPDRWGRLVAWVRRDSSDAPGESLAERALAAGLALYRPDASAKPCRDRLLAAEQAARAARRGLWSEAGSGPLDAVDAKAILAAEKGLVVVEGRVLTIGEQRGRLYLNFGPRRTTDFTIVISKRKLALFEAARVPLRQLAGRRLRARGLVDRSFGPVMEVVSPDALELLDSAPAGTETNR